MKQLNRREALVAGITTGVILGADFPCEVAEAVPAPVTRRNDTLWANALEATLANLFHTWHRGGICPVEKLLASANDLIAPAWYSLISPTMRPCGTCEANYARHERLMTPRFVFDTDETFDFPVGDLHGSVSRVPFASMNHGIYVRGGKTAEERFGAITVKALNDLAVAVRERPNLLAVDFAQLWATREAFLFTQFIYVNVVVRRTDVLTPSPPDR